jgi:hypothetical protein
MRSDCFANGSSAPVRSGVRELSAGAGDRWELLPTVTREQEAASDHAAVVAEIAVQRSR